jgi:hypothetical protein
MTNGGSDRQAETRRTMSRRRWGAISVLSLAAATSGCVNFGAMMSKMILGDPQIDASFKQRTGKTLDEKHPVLVYCTAPSAVIDYDPSIPIDLQTTLSRRMSLRKIKTINSSDVSRAVDQKGGRADAQSLCRMFPEADFLIVIAISGFDCHEPNSPTLFRGYAGGMMRAYSVTGEEGSRHPSQIFEQEFQVEHPTHPVPKDSISETAFQKKFIEHVAEQIGHVFYDFRASEIL